MTLAQPISNNFKDTNSRWVPYSLVDTSGSAVSAKECVLIEIFNVDGNVFCSRSGEDVIPNTFDGELTLPRYLILLPPTVARVLLRTRRGTAL
jgi:hypothetical protein